LREYLGTENEKGDIKKVFSEPNKSKINSLTRKEKTTVVAVALHSPTFSGGQSFNL
jgi:hypothetical protein